MQMRLISPINTGEVLRPGRGRPDAGHGLRGGHSEDRRVGNPRGGNAPDHHGFCHLSRADSTTRRGIYEGAGLCCWWFRLLTSVVLVLLFSVLLCGSVLYCCFWDYVPRFVATRVGSFSYNGIVVVSKSGQIEQLRPRTLI